MNNINEKYNKYEALQELYKEFESTNAQTCLEGSFEDSFDKSLVESSFSGLIPDLYARYANNRFSIGKEALDEKAKKTLEIELKKWIYRAMEFYHFYISMEEEKQNLVIRKYLDLAKAVDGVELFEGMLLTNEEYEELWK